MISLVLWFLICIVLSAFFSAAEMAFVSGDRVKIREKMDSGNRPAYKISLLYKNPQQFLTTILIANNIANITGTAILTYFFSSSFGIQNEWLITAIMAPLLLIFAEILPKDYARTRAEPVLLSFSSAIILLSRLLSPLTAALLKGAGLFLKPLAGDPAGKSIFVSEQEFRSIVEESMKSGIVTQHEKKIIDTILDFEKTQVKDVMTSVEKVPKVELHSCVKDVKDIARETGTKMMLVYEEIPSIVMGMIYVFDVLFEENDQKTLQNILRSPTFIPENTSNESAFFTLQQRRQSYAVVVDETQEVTGVVGIERLLTI